MSLIRRSILFTNRKLLVWRVQCCRAADQPRISDLAIHPRLSQPPMDTEVLDVQSLSPQGSRGQGTRKMGMIIILSTQKVNSQISPSTPHPRMAHSQRRETRAVGDRACKLPMPSHHSSLILSGKVAHRRKQSLSLSPERRSEAVEARNAKKQGSA